MAMALLDAHVPPARFRIDAMDICVTPPAQCPPRDIRQAAPFGVTQRPMRERYFEPVPGDTARAGQVRPAGGFQQGNLLERRVSARVSACYDVVFCRNLLIYFDRATRTGPSRTRSICWCRRGSCSSGSSESGVFVNHAFSRRSCRWRLPFARDSGRAPKLPAAVLRFSASPLAGPSRALRSSQPPAQIKLPPPPESGADEAIELADQGHFAEASRCCEAQLLRQGPSAQVFHVLGLVRDASGNADDAAIYYRKALYLDPGHQDALVHLALLMEKQGD